MHEQWQPDVSSCELKLSRAPSACCAGLTSFKLEAQAGSALSAVFTHKHGLYISLSTQSGDRDELSPRSQVLADPQTLYGFFLKWGIPGLTWGSSQICFLPEIEALLGASTLRGYFSKKNLLQSKKVATVWMPWGEPTAQSSPCDLTLLSGAALPCTTPLWSRNIPMVIQLLTLR